MRYPEDWQKGDPLAKRLLFHFVPDIEASVAMLEAGKVDIVPRISPLIARRIEKEEGIKVVSPDQVQRFISMAADRKPFDDNRPRLAFKYCMDPEILAKACQGKPDESIFYKETPVMNSPARNKAIAPCCRDIEKAKALVAQAVKELASQAGFDIELKGHTRDVYLAQYWMNELS